MIYKNTSIHSVCRYRVRGAVTASWMPVVGVAGGCWESLCTACWPLPWRNAEWVTIVAGGARDRPLACQPSVWQWPSISDRWPRYHCYLLIIILSSRHWSLLSCEHGYDQGVVILADVISLNTSS